MCKLLSQYASKENFEKILNYLLESIKPKIKEYELEPDYCNLSLLQNYLIFFMVLTLNLKKYPLFIKTVFTGKTKFFRSLVKEIFKLKNPNKKKLLGILSNIFMEEYKTIYFREGNEYDQQLVDLFINEQTKFSSKYLDSSISYDSNTYKKMFQILLDFDISYNNFFDYNNNDIKDEERPAYKLCISQSLIRVAFSKEKSKYYNETEFYEYELLKKIIDKDMKETVKKFGDEYKTLFRKEDLCDDFIKYMFFIFGNTMMVESFVKPLKNMLDKIGITEQLINKKNKNAMNRDITITEFDELMSELIQNLIKTIPLVLKILLKILHESVNIYFTIEKDNYGPLYTSLFFNFIISPRIQAIYSINPMNCTFIWSLNRLLRNCCFNFKFGENDKLSIFNEVLSKNHLLIKNFIKEHIISIIIDNNVKNSLKDLFTEKYLIYPKFLFYWDSRLLCSTFTGGVDKIIDFKELKEGRKKGSWSVEKEFI